MSAAVTIDAPDGSLGELDELRPLWEAMQVHQIEVATHHGLNRDLVKGWRARRAWYERELTGGGVILRARRDGRLIGYCALRIERGFDDTFDADGIATIITLSVVPEERGRGVGTRLLDAARGFARTVPATVLALEVMPGNERAADLYRSMGFEEVEVRMHRQV